MAPRIVILDRDGVINFDSPDYIKTADEWQPIPGSIEAIARMHAAGIEVHIATNQAGIARGKLSIDALSGIHEKLLRAVAEAGGAIASIQFCPHHPDDRCACRKPEPGMLRAIEESSGIDIAGQPYVGDSLKDVHAAESAGCRPVVVLTGNGQETARLRADVDSYQNLYAFVSSIC